MKTIFVFAYYSYNDPVFQSAVLSYLKTLKSDDIRFVLLTWEQGVYSLTQEEIKNIQVELRNFNIIWHKANWNSGRYKVLKKIYDFSRGLMFSGFLIYRYRAQKIFSEGFPGAIIGHFLSKITRKSHIIHTFEPHAEYMADSGVWSTTSWEYRLLKKLEIPIANHAENIMTGTGSYKQVLLDKGIKANISVVPSCIDTEFYRFLPRERARIRDELNIKRNQIVITYLGKLGGMYMSEEIFQFFQNCITYNFDEFHFFLFTDHDQIQVELWREKFSIPKSKLTTKLLKKADVPAYLSASDIGFCGVKPIPSQRYSSPIKNGEYWSCGLPILIPKGISDDYIIADEESIGYVFEDIDDITKSDLLNLINVNREHIRNVAITKRNVHNYKDMLLKLLY